MKSLFEPLEEKATLTLTVESPVTYNDVVEAYGMAFAKHFDCKLLFLHPSRSADMMTTHSNVHGLTLTDMLKFLTIEYNCVVPENRGLLIVDREDEHYPYLHPVYVLDNVSEDEENDMFLWKSHIEYNVVVPDPDAMVILKIT